jgi:hypothetical protein
MGWSAIEEEEVGWPVKIKRKTISLECLSIAPLQLFLSFIILSLSLLSLLKQLHFYPSDGTISNMYRPPM